MTNVLWFLAFANVAYLVVALRKSQTVKTKISLADQVRILTVPEQMLSVRPVAKAVSIKESSTVDGQWWEKKIQGHHSKNSGRRHHEPEQLLLSDTDLTLR
jgi:hypothetical protein